MLACKASRFPRQLGGARRTRLASSTLKHETSALTVSKERWREVKESDPRLSTPAPQDFYELLGLEFGTSDSQPLIRAAMAQDSADSSMDSPEPEPAAAMPSRPGGRGRSAPGAPVAPSPTSSWATSWASLGSMASSMASSMGSSMGSSTGSSTGSMGSMGSIGSSTGSMGSAGSMTSMGSTDGGAEELSVRGAYRRLQRIVHPDLVGPAATPLAVLLNSAYATLTDAQARAAYDVELRAYRKGMGNYDGRPVSRWAGGADETLAVFVDETTCIGCGNCTMLAASTFFIEDEYGRARVHTQWGDDSESVQMAVESCPVDCIYYVQRRQLPLLEFVMKRCKREDTAMLARRRSGNMSPAPSSENPFSKAEVFVKMRKDAKLDEAQIGVRRMHDEHLAAAIASAWLALPEDVRRKGWPHWYA